MLVWMPDFLPCDFFWRITHSENAYVGPEAICNGDPASEPQFLFTGESRFYLDFTDRCDRSWRKPSTCLHIEARPMWWRVSHDIERNKVNGKTDLHSVDNSILTAERYFSDILLVHVRPYARAMGPDFILTQDTTLPHTAHLTIQYLAQKHSSSCFSLPDSWTSI